MCPKSLCGTERVFDSFAFFPRDRKLARFLPLGVGSHYEGADS